MLWSSTNEYWDENVYSKLKKLRGLNVLVYGPTGSSKRAYVKRFVQECINIPHEDWKWTTFVINDEKKTEVSLFVKQSRLHVEYILGEFVNNQKYFIKGILKQIVKNLSISNDGSLCSKLVVIYNIHLLSNSSQQELKTLVEKYSNQANFMFVTNRYGSIIPTIISNTIGFRIPRPETKSLRMFVNKILAVEGVNISTRIINQYIEKNDNHIFKTLDSLQFHAYKIPNEVEKQFLKLYENISAGHFKNIREGLYILMVNNIPPETIITAIVIHFKSPQITRFGSIYAYNIVNSERTIYHLEAFTNSCVRCMKSDSSRPKNKK